MFRIVYLIDLNDIQKKKLIWIGLNLTWLFGLAFDFDIEILIVYKQIQIVLIIKSSFYNEFKGFYFVFGCWLAVSFVFALGWCAKQTMSAELFFGWLAMYVFYSVFIFKKQNIRTNSFSFFFQK